MADVSGGCAACERIARIRAGQDPELVAELSESYAVLGDSQHWEGWCVLLLKEHHEHLADLPIERQTRLFGDVARVAAAVREVCSPRRINYECLGNVLAHIHWHVIPRYAPPRDAEPGATIWTRPAAEREDRGDEGRRRALVEALRRAIAAG